MPLIDVWVTFVSEDEGKREDDRRRYLEAQRSLPASELINDEDGLRYRLDADDETAALMRANTLRNGFCEEVGIDRERVHVSLSAPEPPAPLT
jgi:hypothetical protein